MKNGRGSSHRSSVVGTLYHISFNEYHSLIVKKSASAKKPSELIVTIADDGQSVLPDIDFYKGKLANMKTPLSEYLKKCYQKSMGDAKAKIQWGQLQQNPGKFIKMMVNFLQEGASLLDPSHIHICQGVLIDILCHLKEHQDNKVIKVVFTLRNPGTTHRPILERRSSTASSSSESSHTATPGPSQSAFLRSHDPLPVPTSLTASLSLVPTLLTASPSPVPTSRAPSLSPIPVLLTPIPVLIPNPSPKLSPTKQRKVKTGSSP
jgi:hypothetical protein